MKIIFRKFKKFIFYQKIAQAGVIKILITILLTLETMQQLIIKPRRRSLGPWCRKKKSIFKKLEKIANIAISPDNKISKNIPLHLQTMK